MARITALPHLIQPVQPPSTFPVHTRRGEQVNRVDPHLFAPAHGCKMSGLDEERSTRTNVVFNRL
jgi:hypothetical protein